MLVEWTRLSVLCPPAASEAVVGAMLDLLDSGSSVEETPEGSLVCAYLAQGTDLAQAVAQVEARLAAIPEDLTEGVALVLRQGTVRDEDWAHAWKEHYFPFRVGARLVVKPTWRQWPPTDDPGAAREDDLVLELDPEMAFGTGTHATTQLCLRAVEERVRPGDALLDVGCGSGILAIAALKVGAGRACGVDLDPVAVSTTAANAERNGVGAALTVHEGGISSAEAGPYDVVVANVNPPVVTAIADEVAQVLRPGGLYLASGTLLEHVERVTAAVSAAGLELVGVADQEGWVCVTARKPEE